MELQVDITQLEIKLYNPFANMTYKYISITLCISRAIVISQYFY